jgi:hypothetical protein
MTLALASKLLSFIGGLLTLLPSLQVLWANVAANRIKASSGASSGIKDFAKVLRDATGESFVKRYTLLHLIITAAGLALIVLGFALDLMGELHGG